MSIIPIAAAGAGAAPATESPIPSPRKYDPVGIFEACGQCVLVSVGQNS